MNLEVRVGNTPMGGFATSPLLPASSGNALCYAFPAGIPLGAGATNVQCSTSPLSGRYVSVQGTNNPQELNIAEVMVYAILPPPPRK